MTAPIHHSTALWVSRPGANDLPPIERHRQFRAVLYETLALGLPAPYIAQVVNRLRAGEETPTVADLRRVLGLKKRRA